MERFGERYRLSTGREFGANDGILGLGPDGVYQGYDGIVFLEAMDEYDEPSWTLAERRELSNYMIERWTIWRDQQ